MNSLQTTRLKPKHVRFVAITISMLLLVLIWSGFFVTTRSINTNFDSAAIRSLTSETAYIDDQLDRAFQQVDTTLSSAASILKLLAEENASINSENLLPLVGSDRLIRSLSLLDVNGRVIASSNSNAVGFVIPIAPLLQNARPTNTTNQGVIYGQVEPYRTVNDWAESRKSPTQRLIPAVKSLILNDKPYTLLVTINVALFNNFWERIGHNANTEISVFTYDGLKILSHHEQGIVAQGLFNAVDEAMRINKIGYFFWGAEEQFLIAYRASQQYPKVTVSIANLGQLKKSVRAEIEWLFTIAAIGSILLGLIVFLTYRLYIRYERVTNYSQNLLDGITAHVMMSRSDSKGIVEDVNAPFLKTTGYKREELVGKKDHMFESAYETQLFHNDLWQTIQSGRIWKSTFRNKNKQGDLIWLNGTIIPLKNEWGEINQFVAMYSNITEAIKMSEEIERERVARHALEALNKKLQTDATRDALTGVWNRRGLDQFLEEIASDHYLSHGSVSVLMLDIDDFKLVNDTRGHLTGDDVLCQVSSLWLANIRSSDLLVRLGGDEFAILLFRNSAEDTWLVAEKLRAATEAIKILAPGQDEPIAITVSIGIAHAKFASKEAINVLIKRADTALYEAKQAGRNCLKVADRLTDKQ